MGKINLEIIGQKRGILEKKDREVKTGSNHEHYQK